MDDETGFNYIFDVDVEESVKRQLKRNDLYVYSLDVLAKEKAQYIEYAKYHKFPIIKSSDIETTKIDVLKVINDIYKKSE